MQESSVLVVHDFVNFGKKMLKEFFGLFVVETLHRLKQLFLGDFGHSYKSWNMNPLPIIQTKHLSVLSNKTHRSVLSSDFAFEASNVTVQVIDFTLQASYFLPLFVARPLDLL